MSDSLAAPDDRLRIVVAQLNPVLGDVAGNAAQVRATRAEAARQEADLIVFPELFLSGAPTLGLARDPGFLAACRAQVEALAREDGPALLLGTPWEAEGRIYNAVLLLEDGQIRAERFKVAAEAPFDAGPLPGPIPFRDTRLGLVIGQDLMAGDVCECLSETGAELLIAPVTLPYEREARDARLSAIVARVVETALPLLLVNAVGAEEGGVFDGGSLALGADRRLALHFPSFLERARMSEWQRFESGWHCLGAPAADALEGTQADYAALLLGLRDRVRKGGHGGVVIDLATGSEARFAALLAVDALGAGAVHALLSRPDAAASALATQLGLSLHTLDLSQVDAALRRALAVPEGAPLSTLLGPALESLASATGSLALAPASRTSLRGGRVPPGTFNPLADLDSSDLVALSELRARWKPAEGRGPSGINLNLAAKTEAPPPIQAEAARRRAPPGLRLTGRPPVGDPLFPVTTRYKTQG